MCRTRRALHIALADVDELAIGNREPGRTCELQADTAGAPRDRDEVGGARLLLRPTALDGCRRSWFAHQGRHAICALRHPQGFQLGAGGSFSRSADE
jgi:hypothetical protein